MQEWEIWMQGYSATGEHANSQRIAYMYAETFDEAVQKYMATDESGNNHGIESYTREQFISDEAWLNRHANYHIWACGLYPTQKEASYFDY